MYHLHTQTEVSKRYMKESFSNRQLNSISSEKFKMLEKRICILRDHVVFSNDVLTCLGTARPKLFLSVYAFESHSIEKIQLRILPSFLAGLSRFRKK